MASINVGKVTDFLNDFVDAIKNKTPISSENIDKAKRLGFNTAAEVANRHNAGEPVGDVTVEALSKKTKQPTPPPAATQTTERPDNKEKIETYRNLLNQKDGTNKVQNEIWKGQGTSTEDIKNIPTQKQVLNQVGVREELRDFVGKSDLEETPPKGAKPQNQRPRKVNKMVNNGTVGETPATPAPDAKAETGTASAVKTETGTASAVNDKKDTPESKSLENIQEAAKPEVAPKPVAEVSAPKAEQPAVEFKQADGQLVPAKQAQSLAQEYKEAVAGGGERLTAFQKKIKTLGYTMFAGGLGAGVLAGGEPSSPETKPPYIPGTSTPPPPSTSEQQEKKKTTYIPGTSTPSPTTPEQKTVMYLGKPVTKTEYIQRAQTTEEEFNYLYNQQQEDKTKQESKSAEKFEEKEAELQQKINDRLEQIRQIEKNTNNPSSNPSNTFALAVQKAYLEKEQKALQDFQKTRPASLVRLQEAAQQTKDFTPNLKDAQIAELDRQLADPNKSPEAKAAIKAARDRLAGTTAPAAPSTPPSDSTPAPAPAPAAPKVFNPQNPAQVEQLGKVVFQAVGTEGDKPAGTPDPFAERQKDLQKAINDAKLIYEQAISKAKSDAERRESIAAWGQIAEQIAQGLVKFLAAKEGKRLGARIGSDIKFEKHDWNKDLDRSMEKLKGDLSLAKEQFGIVQKEVEAGREELSKEKVRIEDREHKRADMLLKAALDSKENQRQEKARAAMKADERAFEAAQNAAKLNQALRIQEMRLDQAKAALQSKFSATQRKEADTVKSARTEAAGIFNSWYSAKSKQKTAEGDKFAKAAKSLQLTAEEMQEVKRLSEGPGFFSEAENKATLNAILQQAEIRRLNNLSGGQLNLGGGAEEAQTSGQARIIMVKPDGTKIYVPQDEIDIARQGGAVTPEEFEAQRRK